MLKPGSFLEDRYEIIKHIGSGGMADVYKAKCHKLDRFVAIKVLKPEYYDDDKAVKKFIAEARATSDLQHPNLVNIFDAENNGDVYYIVMELAEGITLKQYIRQKGRIPARETVDFAQQIANGISAAHEQKIIHRDIKPQNILLTGAGAIKVADFGIAKVASGDTIGMSPFGSVHYISPEQARGGYADERSDIYSLGISLYEMVTGRVPFDAENSVSIALKHLHENIVPPSEYAPDIPSSLENIILKCTMKRPDSRYQSVKELIIDLEKVFSAPNGDYVTVASLVDDSPTNIHGEKEIEQVRAAHKRVRRTQDDVPTDRKKTRNQDFVDVDEEVGGGLGGKIAIFLAIIAGVSIIIIAALFLIKGINKIGGPRPVAEATTQIASPEEEEQIEMPNLIYLSKDEAEKSLKGYGLTAVFQYEEGVNEKAANLVVTKQSVAEGTIVSSDTDIALTLGSYQVPTGPVAVPGITNMSFADAKIELAKAGLNYEAVYRSTPDQGDYVVVEQNPTAGSTLQAGSSVSITVNVQGELTTVPMLAGVNEQSARAKLDAAGLQLGYIVKGYSNNVGEGEIMDQITSSGSEVPVGSEISIIVSMGFKPDTMYQSNLRIAESPFKDGEEGEIRMVLNQNGEERTIFYDEDADETQFPLDLTFYMIEDGEGEVTVYTNDKEYSVFTVSAKPYTEQQ